MGFAEFLRERQYLLNVSPATLDWYRNAFKWLPSASPSHAELKDVVMRMRAKGLRPTGCNSSICAINCYLKWAGLAERIAYLKEDQRILPTFTSAQVLLLTKHRPKGRYPGRLHMIVLVLLDTGTRIDEVLTLRVQDVDMDNLLLTVTGKGRKQRRIPFSFELRRVLYRHIADRQGLVFATRHGKKLGRRNVLRDVKLLCKKLGFVPPERTLHAFRHTFAVNYLRRGGSAFHLQKVLGHSSLEMTRRYANLMTEDLQAVHQKISLLAA
jgi:integrase/recombinase XerD